MMNNRSRESACRSLFGPVDHDQLRLDFQLHLKEMSEQDTRRWNFNFQSNTPLHGRFQWEEIPSACTESFYQESKQLEVSVGLPTAEEDQSLSEEKRSGKDQENCSSISNKPIRLTGGTPCQRKQLFSKAATKHRATAQITDFFAKRRRSVGFQTTTPYVQTTSTEAMLCKTIR